MKKFVSLVVICVMATAVSASEFDGPNAKNIYISPGFTYYESPDGIGVDDGDVGPGLIIGYGFTDRLLGEFLISRIDTDYRILGTSGSDDTELKWINFLFKPFATEGRYQPFLLAGGGITETEFDGVRNRFDDNQFNVGVGLFSHINDRFFLRADLRGVHSRDEGGIKPMAFIGLGGMFGNVDSGPPPDTDGDGVPDRKDKCPNTLPGRDVGPDGCELDSDGDGVVDGDDQCPNTPTGVSVDERGCPPDADTDGDGVIDSKDACPDTPAGVAVDRRGCPLDGDGDGVPDYLDKCPDSEAGALVDENGCYIELEEAVTIDLNLEFDTNSADIRAGERSKIQEVVEFLRKYPTASAVIEGHTDSDGAQAYNQQLSERRARAVYNYLIGDGGVAAGRLTFVGFGETRPIASNDTAEGKQRNRRVSAVVSGTQTVRKTR